MGSYTALADLETRYGADEILQLTDRDGDDAADTGVADAAIADAEALIDSYLYGVVTLPIDAADVPLTLKKVASDIARYNLYQDGAPEAVVKRFDDAIAWLKKVSNGEASLGIDAEGETAATVTPADGLALKDEDDRTINSTVLSYY